MDKREQELEDMLRRNPQLRIVGDTSITRNTDNERNTDHTRRSVIQVEEDLRAEAEAMLESELQSELRRIALAANFLYYHTYNSRKSDIGFLDTVLLRVRINSGELYFVECKREGQDPTEEQQRWVEAVKTFRARANNFMGIPVTVDAFVWRPMDLLSGRIKEILSSQLEVL